VGLHGSERALDTSRGEVSAMRKSGRRCLFCLGSSESSVSVEHIVPESLGNTTMTLPPGIVCDVCNSYFGRKVEAPFLDSPPIKGLRHTQGLANKRGRIPDLEVVIDDGTVGQLTVSRHDPIRRSLAVPEDTLRRVLLGDQSSHHMWFPTPDSVQPDRQVARFVAKAGLELVAERNLDFPLGLAMLMQAPELEMCRRFARYGDGPKVWELRVGPLYEPDHMFIDTLPDGQRVWEMDLLIIDEEFMIFAMSIFGLEFVINLTGPTLAPYDRWRLHRGAPSLLYPEGVPADLGRARSRGDQRKGRQN
jgi:hypothetical protein